MRSQWVCLASLEQILPTNHTNHAKRRSEIRSRTDCVVYVSRAASFTQRIRLWLSPRLVWKLYFPRNGESVQMANISLIGRMLDLTSGSGVVRDCLRNV